MSIADVLFGRPLASDEERRERIGVSQGVPIFGLDALSSAAYGPEAALTVLIPLGLAGLAYAVPISGAIIVLLAIVYFSYRQTIAAYPGGGGSYTVARENLGAGAGLFAACALIIDYVLNVAVGISAGVGALISAVPSLQPHTLSLCLCILALLAIINLRGLREAGLVFMAPTYLFLGTLLIVIAWGLLRSHPAVPPPHAPPVREAFTTWILLRAFASGCTAMTGVEAVSNGVQAFAEPVVTLARRTLTAIIAFLIVLLAGIAILVVKFHIAATEPGQPGYESILSQLTGAVAGKGVFYYVTIASILLVLSLSANTSFADFPRVCRAIAQDGYLPYSFAIRGRRLVYSEGIYVLTVLSGGLLIVFRGVTDRLIPLFAVGAFMAFTLSQAGMVVHWKRTGGRGARASQLVNGLGAIATGVTLCVVLVAKFTEGAWLTVVTIPCLLVLMLGVHRHYRRVSKELASPEPLDLVHLSPPIVVVPVDRWNRTVKKALQIAVSLSQEVHALHIHWEEEPDGVLHEHWDEFVEKPARELGTAIPKLVVVKSPYRTVIGPIVKYVLNVEMENPARPVAVVIPELVERRWYHYFLHNHRAEVLKAQLLLRGNRRILMVNVPWYLEDPHRARRT